MEIRINNKCRSVLDVKTSIKNKVTIWIKGELPVCTMAPLIQETLLVPLSSCIEITENELSVQSFTISYEQNPTNKPYVKFVTKIHVQGSS